MASNVQGKVGRWGVPVRPQRGKKLSSWQLLSFLHFQEFLRIFGSGQLETEPQTRQNVGPAAELLAGLRIPEISWSRPGLSNR